MRADPPGSNYVVIGNPVSHSLSPVIHARFAAQTGEQLTYGRLEAAPGRFDEAATAFFAAGGQGANVTVPFKEDAAAWVQELDGAADTAAAVNTIVPLGEGVFRGLNTDGAGLVADLKRLLGARLDGARILVLGAGGAVRGVIAPLAALGPARLVIANRTRARADALVAHFAARGVSLSATGLAGIGGVFDLVINGTSAGLDAEVPAINDDLVRGAFCYDLLYGADTPFCRWARAAGAAATADGIGMLVEQAALAFYAWRGKLPDTAAVRRELSGAGR